MGIPVAKGHRDAGIVGLRIQPNSVLLGVLGELRGGCYSELQHLGGAVSQGEPPGTDQGRA